MDPLLEHAKEAFSQWKSTHKRQGKITNELKNMALALLQKHTVRAVSEAIGVSSSALNNWKCKAKLTENKEGTTHFISLPISHNSQSVLTSTPTASAPEIQITLPGHLQLIISEQPTELTIQFIRALSKEFSL